MIVFDSETGAYKRHWGAYGKPPSDAQTPPYDPARPPSQQFGNPVHCVRMAKDGLVYVCDRTNDRFQVFRKDGTFVSEAFFEKNTRLNGSVSEMAFSPDTGQSLIYMVDGVNNEMRIVDRATTPCSAVSAARAATRGSFTSCTTSPWTRKATSTRPRSTPGSASRNSAGWTRRTDGASERALQTSLDCETEVARWLVLFRPWQAAGPLPRRLQYPSKKEARAYQVVC